MELLWNGTDRLNQTTGKTPIPYATFSTKYPTNNGQWSSYDLWAERPKITAWLMAKLSYYFAYTHSKSLQVAVEYSASQCLTIVIYEFTGESKYVQTQCRGALA
jgi:hypothetical protein